MRSSPRSSLSLALAFTLIVGVSCSYQSPLISASPANAPTLEVFFPPRGGAIEAVIPGFGIAKQGILVQQYADGIVVAMTEIVHGRSRSDMLQAGIIEYAFIISGSVGDILTYSWLERNRAEVAIFGIIILVLIFVVFKS